MTVVIDGTTGIDTIQPNTVTSAKIVDGTIVPADIAQPFTSGTAVASTSGTFIDFTSIPSWVKRITLILSNISTNGANPFLLQIGSGSVQTTGYACAGSGIAGAVATSSYTNGFGYGNAGGAALNSSGITILALVGANTWICSGSMALGVAQTNLTNGSVTLAGALDRVRLTTTTGVDTFDAGSVNILYEG